MRTRTLDCPTCGSMQAFRFLDDREKAALRKREGPQLFLDNLWRCTAAGCLTYYPQFNKAGYGRLPEEFREEGTATEPG
ncbi:hypothetical protein [Streptomyces sp. NPDC003635]